MPSPFLHPRQTSLIENQFPLTTLRFQLNTGFVQQLQPMQYYPASHHCPICQLLATSQGPPPTPKPLPEKHPSLGNRQYPWKWTRWMPCPVLTYLGAPRLRRPSRCGVPSSFGEGVESWTTMCRSWVPALVFLYDQGRECSILSHWAVLHRGLHCVGVMVGKG